MKKIIGLILSGGLAFFVLIQLIPYGRNHTNPPVIQEINWPSEEGKQITQRACYDCHNNETTWPWYSNIAPVSWLVQRDVEQGRQRLNFSESGRAKQDLNEIDEILREGEMPPSQYLITHPQASLTSTERKILIGSLVAIGGQRAEKENDEP